MAQSEIKLIPGTPNDANRDYLPEAIKGSKMVVNENGNNSQPYPERLIEHQERLVDDVVDIWYEYVPVSYDGKQQVPLVISMHGGLMTGWGQAVYTSWTHVAEKEDVIVIFPNAHSRRFWMIECEEEKIEELTTPNSSGVYMHPFPKNVEENHDVRFVLALIDHVCTRYNIDPERIYMQGMSLGNSMTAMIARYYGYRFAAMAGSAGPSTVGLLFDKNGVPNNMGGPVDIWQTRMELDGNPPGSDHDVETTIIKNRDYWLQINGCNELPQIRIDGQNNMAFYKGENADFVYREVKNRDHGQTFDDAQRAWDYLFSGVRRISNGQLVRTESNLKRKGDNFALAVADNCSYVWFNNQKVPIDGRTFTWNKLKYHGLNGDSIIRGSYIMIPVASLAQIFGADYIEEKNSGVSSLTLSDGRNLTFARGCFACTLDNRVRDMLCEAVERDGSLYISAEWFCLDVMGLHTTTCNHALYATDHYAILSSNMARLIRDMLTSDD